MGGAGGVQAPRGTLRPRPGGKPSAMAAFPVVSAYRFPIGNPVLVQNLRAAAREPMPMATSSTPGVEERRQGWVLPRRVRWEG